MSADRPLKPGVEGQLERLPVACIAPNAYNPNTMTAAGFAELVAEVRHLGRLPKPLVVTRHADRWRIVDGEHGWQAALAVGLEDVWCEVIEADLFEAMRQTYKRNQHGRHDSVRLGRMFVAMMEDRGLSRRDLAVQMAVAEGTIRNAVIYATAAELRNGYAAPLSGVAEDADRLIAGLTVRQVREYVRLPAPIRDTWLDAGADLNALAKAAVVRIDEGGKTRTVVLDDPDSEIDVWQELVQAGLADRVTASDFVGSAHEAFRLLLFRRQHQPSVEHIDAYLKPLVDWQMSSDLVGNLPCRADGDRTEVLISPARWTAILRDCAGRAEHPANLERLIRVSLRLALQDAGLDTRDASDPRTIEAERVVSRAPRFIRESSLPLPDKHVLTLLLSKPDVAESECLEAVHRACTMLEGVREAARAGRLSETAPALWPLLADAAPLSAFDVARADIQRERADAECREIVADRQRLTDALLDKLGGTDTPSTGAGADGQVSIRGLLRKRLDLVPTPELQLLGVAALGWQSGLGLWLEAVSSAAPDDRQELGESGDGTS